MPYSEDRTAPKSEAYGAGVERERFVQGTALPQGDPSAGGAPVSLPEPPPPTGNVSEVFGSLDELLFAPTEREFEDPGTPSKQSQLLSMFPSPPAVDMVRLAQDRSLSEEFRSLMAWAAISSAVPAGRDD